MNRILCSAAIAGLSCALLGGHALAQGRSPRVDPRLRRALTPEMQRILLAKYPQRAQGRDLAAIDDQPLGGALVVDRGAQGGGIRIGTIVHVRSSTGVDELRRAGADIGSVIPLPDGGSIVTARIPMQTLPTITTSSAIVRIDADHMIEVVNDSSVHAIGADLVRQRNGSNWSGVAGQGVIVGIYDTGIDYRHDDFIDGAGRTRLLGIWDQTLTSTAGKSPPAGFNYGGYCTPADIQSAINGSAASCPQNDSNGHGTHVTGTAAGDGSAVGNGGTAYQYAGVAPAADIIFVKGGNGSFSEASILDGLVFLAQQSRALRKPISINLSLGSQDGPHDGSSLFEKGIDGVGTNPNGTLRDSVIISIASGNGGANNNTTPITPPVLVHASARTTTGQSAEFTITVPTYTPNTGTCNDFAVVDIWFANGDQYDVTVTRPDGTSLSAGPNQSVANDSTGGGLSIDQGAKGGDITTPDSETEVVISDCLQKATTPAPGVWRIRVTGRAVQSAQPYHMWLTRTQFGPGLRAQGDQGFDNHYIVDSPGTANNAITVGAFATRECWPGTGGTFCYTAREAIGDLARFSAGGPSRDGRMKPEIVAPGIGIMSSMSRDASQQAARVAPDGVHFVNQGTSMAAPHVTGAIALMLQLKPKMNVADVRALLALSAKHDAFTTRTYGIGLATDWWGSGKLDVRSAITLLQAGSNNNAVASVNVTPHADTLVVNGTTQVRAVASDAFGAPVGRPITFSSTNPAVAIVDVNGVVTGKSPGSTYIVAQLDTKRDSAAVQVVGPATLSIKGSSLAAGGGSSAKGTRVPLLKLQLGSVGFESIDVSALVFDARGSDPGARVLVLRDVNRNGAIDSEDVVLGSAPVNLQNGVVTHVVVPLTALRIGARDSVSLIAAIEMGGAAPNLSAFQLTLAPQETRTIGVLSLAQDQVTQPTAAIASTSVQTTLLKSTEIFALSENPVRSGKVIFNFSVRPTVAGIFTLTGRRVTDLLPRMSSDGRVEWDLRNDDGGLVAAGVYLVVFSVSGQLVREKLFVARPSAP
jgi:subtilisin family serine protease